MPKADILPEKTVERLSQYRRVLLNCLDRGQQYIYSHDFADLLHITAVQVRRDIMLMGYSSRDKRGYDIQAMVDMIGKVIDSDMSQNVAVIGIGNLGRAITSYFKGKRQKLDIVASFDSDKDKIGKVIAGVKCYSILDLDTIIAEKNISVAILTVPAENAKELAARLFNSGIKGILNFTSTPINTPEGTYLEQYDMITFLEKVAYFAQNPQ